MTQLILRCPRCGCDQFKLTAVVGDDETVGDILTECTRCGSTDRPGYLPDVDPPKVLHT